MKNLVVLAVFTIVIAGAVVFISVGNKKEADMKNVDMFAGSSLMPVTTKDLEYSPQVMGFYARPSAEGVFPGVVMIHEWWGLNENIKETAKQLAGQGYQVLAVDLFGSVATTADEARALVANLDQAKAVENLRAATAYLRGQGSAKIASLGWCFGGAQSVELSVSGEPLDATIVYYGRLINDTERLKNIAWPVLGIFGETDQSIPPSAVNEFQAALTTLGIENDITIYPGVGHAFANPSGDNYAPEETKDAWAKVLAFLEANLKN